MMPGTHMAGLRLQGVRLGHEPAGTPLVDIVLRAGAIARVAPTAARPPADAHSDSDMDCTGLIAFAGFVNAHTHSTEMFEQGAYDCEALEPWLAMAYPPLGDDKLPARWHYLRAMQLAMMSLRSGVTALHDDFLNPGLDADALAQVTRAYRDAGLRARVAVTLSDRPYLEGMPLVQRHLAAGTSAALNARVPRDFASQADFFVNALSDVDSHGGSLVNISLGPRGPQRCTMVLLRGVAALAQRHAVPVHMHVLESRIQALTAQHQHGVSFVHLLDDAGLLNSSLALNHAVWLTADDIDRIARSGARVVHNPLSNFKLASGLCPVKRLLAAGVEVALGTDGAATGDSVDFFDTLRFAALVHKLDASAELPAPGAGQLLGMATRAGAATMGDAGQRGELVVGQCADITLVDARDPAFVPLNDPRRQLCYAATSQAVHTTIVAGRIAYTQGRCTLIDEPALRAEIAEAAERFRHLRLVRQSGADDPLLPPLRRMVADARMDAQRLNTVNRICLP